MGSPKALLTLRGQSFLELVVEGLRGGGCDPIIVVTGPEEDADAAMIAESARAMGARTAINRFRDSAQLESLRVAIAALPAQAEALIASPVDAPGISSGVVASLIHAYREGAAIVTPAFAGRRGHPVLFASSLFDELLHEDLPEGARTTMRRHQAALVEIPVTEGGVLLDVDTPADYRRLQDGSE